MDTSEGSSEQLRKRRAAEAAKARRAKVLAQMSQMQKNFAAENKSLLDELEDEDSGRGEETSSQDQEKETICLGPQQNDPKERINKHQCILCQEESSVGSGMPLVMTSFVQMSTVMSQMPTYNGSTDRERPKVCDTYLDAARSCGLHVSSCGHFMHTKCYHKYYETQLLKERQRNDLMTDLTRFMRNLTNFDASAAEYMCPMCDRLCNTVIPVLPQVSTIRKKMKSAPVIEIGLNSFIKGLKELANSVSLPDGDNTKIFEDISSKKTLKELGDTYGPEFASCFKTTGTGTDQPPVEEELLDIVEAFSTAVYTKSLCFLPSEKDFRNTTLCLQSAAFTVLNQELLISYDSKPLFGQSKTRDEELLKQLVRFIVAFPVCGRRESSVRRLNHLRSNALYLLAVLFTDKTKVDIISLDAFGVLVSLLISLPSLFHNNSTPRVLCGRGFELHCLKICFLVHIVQILLGYPEKVFVQFTGMSNPAGKSLISQLVAFTFKSKQFTLDPSKINSTKLLDKLEQDCLPFLRSCSMLFRHLSDIPPGRDLLQNDFEYRYLAKYMGLPQTLALLLESPASQTFLEYILFNKTGFHSESTIHPVFPLSFRRSVPPKVQGKVRQFFPVGNLTEDPSWRGGLIPLPREYLELLNLAGKYSCPNSVTGEAYSPSICLVCGAMVCSHSLCCEETIDGEKVRGCTAHANYCTAGTGIFLNIPDCIVLLLDKQFRGCILSAPYLDKYGETDQRLKRGNPLFLDERRYQDLNRIWLRNDVPEKIAREFDENIIILDEWINF